MKKSDIPVFGDAGAAAGPWLAGAVAGNAGVLDALTHLLPDDGSAGPRAGLLIGTVFPLLVVATALAYAIVTYRRGHAADAA